METRNALVHKASELAEAARNAIRNVRHRGQKDLKADETSKVVGKDQAHKDGVKVMFKALSTVRNDLCDLTCRFCSCDVSAHRLDKEKNRRNRQAISKY